MSSTASLPGHEVANNMHIDANRAMTEILTQGALGKRAAMLWYRITAQLEPGQHIQYITAEPGNEVNLLIQHGLLKPTKKPGYNRFIVPKDKAYASWEPRLNVP